MTSKDYKERLKEMSIKERKEMYRKFSVNGS